MKRSGTAALLVGALFLTGCTVLPGMRNDVDNRSSGDIDIVPINSELVASERKRLAGAQVEVSQTLQALSAGSGYEYRVGPGDILNIIVWDHPELTNPTGQSSDLTAAGRLVNQDGTMFYPNVGVFPVAGRTTLDIRAHLTRELARVIRDPQVDVKVAAFRSQKVYVTGEVAQPGVMVLDDQPKSILDAINERGGMSENADRRRITLSREGQTYPLDLQALYARGDQRSNILLKAGDVVHVGDALAEKVFLLGELTREQAIPIQRGRMSLAEALSTAGGLQTTSANPRAVFVFRAPELADERPKVYAMDLTRGDSLLLAEQFSLQSRDVVYVGSTDFARYNRVIGQLLPTVSTIFQLDRLIND